MCGIAGLASCRPLDKHDLLSRMGDSLRHRGPDEGGAWWSEDRRVGFAHRRLAILDLTRTGRQPMSDEGGRLHVTYNGEIYNHRALRRELEARGHVFRGTSDTEVLLAAYRQWGVECLSRLNGMFAFALHDSASGRLFFARDRAGEKPLFYRHLAGELAFASELKALLVDRSLPRRLDLESLEYYLAYGYVPGARCILEGFHKLAPAHAMTYEPATDRLEVWRYWDLPLPSSDGSVRPEERLEELETLLRDSVRLRLAADVPVGVLLSGGIDSSIVAAVAAEVSSSPLRTFTVTFPGHPRHDEAAHARLVASHLGTAHTEIPAEPASLDLLAELARQYDEPIADSSMVPSCLLARAIRSRTTVALGGDGGDEAFGGYPHYRWLATAGRLRRVLPPGLRRLAGAAALRWLPAGIRGRNHLIGLGGEDGASLAHVNLYFDSAFRRRLVVPRRTDTAAADGSPERWRASLGGAPSSPLQQATRADFRSTLPEAYLVKVDRASMLNSVEVRSPWLDHRIVEFAFGRLADALRCGREGRKVLPRRLARRLLPAALDLDRKQGLSMPLDAWLKQGGASLTNVLQEANPSLLDPRAIATLLEGQRRGRRNAERLFALALLEQWRREYGVVSWQ